MPARSRRRLVRGVVAVVSVVVIVLAGGLLIRAIWHRVTEITSRGCSFGDSSVSTSQASVAATMVGVVIRRSLPQRAAVLVLAAALQESKLTNIPSGQGDRDSVGVLQQRPSQGWGSATKLADVHYATAKFLDVLVKQKDWQSTSLADAIQEVQRSADGSLYTKHEGEATAIAGGLWGQPRGVVCHFAKPNTVAAAATVAAQLSRDLPVSTPTVRGTSIRVPGAGWATAAWLVSNADRLGIAEVDYDGSRWTREHGWQSKKSATTAAVEATIASV